MLTANVLTGQLLVVGFSGTTVPAGLARALAAGERAGVVLFKRNVPADPLEVLSLTRAVAGACPAELPPLVAVDQEGGRVARLGPPLMKLPPMATLGRIGDVDLARRAARAQAKELAALGFTTSFAPVLDVNVNPANPVIGDRAFGGDAAEVARMGVAFARGLQEGGLLACGKHFPGHGDTSKDSHLELPVVDAARERLDAVELAPFRAAAAAGVDMLMTAHVVYRALDDARPATLSPAVSTALARETIGFRGVLVSDDLEMKALSQEIEHTSVAAVEAGCDLLLVCSDEEKAERAHRALIHRVQRDAAFRARCEVAVERSRAMRRRVPPRPAADRAAARAAVATDEARTIADEIARRGA
jgi:beta-N-acetylhexosaminidase